MRDRVTTEILEFAPVVRQPDVVKRFVGEPDFTALHSLIEELLAKR